MQRFIPVIFIAIGLTAWMFFIHHDPFFWDTVQLGSKHAHYFYQNNLHWALLPPAIDSGHPPVFGYYLALVWTFFGKSLVISHWAMFPFLVGIAIALVRLGRRLGAPGWAWWLLPLVWLDPVMAAQSALVGPDLVLAACFLLALEGLFGRLPWLALAGILGLCMISMRGMMTAGALFFWQVMLNWPAIRQNYRNLTSGLPFLPGFAFSAWFLIWHQQQSGWTGFHPNSPWAPAFEQVGAPGFLRNIVILGWRWADFGRFTEWALLGILIYRARKYRIPLPPESKTLAVLCVLLILFLSPSALLYQNLSAHRYFIPIFLVLHLVLFTLLVHSRLKNIVKRVLLTLAITGLATGNLWVYPKGISMGWDATLAHLPYHRLRKEMIKYLEAQKIDFRQVGTAFPNLNTGEDLLLNGDERLFADKNTPGLNFILVSNVFNDFSEIDFQILADQYVLAKRVEHAGVWLELHEKKSGYSPKDSLQ